MNASVPALPDPPDPLCRSKYFCEYNAFPKLFAAPVSPPEIAFAPPVMPAAWAFAPPRSAELDPPTASLPRLPVCAAALSPIFVNDISGFMTFPRLLWKMPCCVCNVLSANPVAYFAAPFSAAPDTPKPFAALAD